MKACDVMTTAVVSVTPETTSRQVAKLLLEKRISAVPVIDDAGTLLGMVSEGDLIGRTETERDTRMDWWLRLLAREEALSTETLAALCSPERTAREVMSVPVVTIGETTEILEIASLLAAYRIKRLPVLRDGRVIGVVSRADLLRTLGDQSKPAAQHGLGILGEVLSSLDERFLQRRDMSAAPRPADLAQAAVDTGVTVEGFRNLVTEFGRGESRHHEANRSALAERGRLAVKELIDQHVSNDYWQDKLRQAREAAEHGKKEILMLRFPSGLCSDAGWAINVLEADWPETLRGAAAEIYLRWKHDLKPRGFRLTARVLEFPRGFPGDVGLFLIWGE